MSGRVLTQRELNRALLARQLLLERVRLPLPRALERIAGIQNQYAPNAYIRLWSCLDGFERDELDRALERRSVVQATLMRGTIHVVSARDFWPFAVGIRRAGRLWWLRVHKPHAERVDLDAVNRAVRELVGGTTRTRDELVQRLSVFDPPGAPRNLAWSGVEVRFVRAPPSGTWARRRAHTFALAEDWLGPATVDEEQGLAHLARRYLAAFGPATRNELADWAGVGVALFKDVLPRLKLRRFRAEDGSELLDVPRAPLPDPDTPAPVRFLPTWDATLLVHARRTGVLPEAYRPRIFHTKAPQSFPTFLVDGAVAGTWRFDNGRIVTEPFERLSRETRAEVRDEAERLAAFYA
jgi:winged helix DNA-binding protein